MIAAASLSTASDRQEPLLAAKETLAVGAEPPMAAKRLIVIEAELVHVYALAPKMRQRDIANAKALGRDPKAALRLSFKSSPFYRRAALCGDEVLALWGLAGDAIGDHGMPWLLVSRSLAAGWRVTLAKMARAEIRNMLARRRVLVDYHSADDAHGARFLRFLGFHCTGESMAGRLHRYVLARG